MEKWILTENEPNIKRMKKRESLWTQGNGYMGIRAAYEEKYPTSGGNVFVNGVFDKPCDESTELAVFPDIVNFEIEADGERFSMSDGKTEEYSSSLNMYTGELTRSLVWRLPDDRKVRIEFSRIVSAARKHIVAQKVKITSLNGDMNIKVVTGVDGKVTNTGVQHFDNPLKRAYKDGVRGMTVGTLQSKVDCAVHYALKCSEDYTDKTVIDRRSIYSHMGICAQSGKTVEIEKISAYAHSRDFEYYDCDADVEKVKEDCIKYVKEAVKDGYDALRAESAEEWKGFWETSLVETVSNDEFLDKAVIFAQYHLNIMASPDDNRLGVGGKALSGEGYGGHSFWDTELFILPYYIMNKPDTARRLLEYRYKLLDVAKEKAKHYGFLGAMYPWEGSWITDRESANQFGDLDLETGARRQFYMDETEIHITAGIAYAIKHYYDATGDKEFMDLYGNEMLVYTALFWASRAEYVNDRYEIRGVIGPDEYKEFVNNNAYTNYMARLNLKLASDVLKNDESGISEKLAKDGYDVKEISEKINTVMEKLYLPMPEDDGIMLQFDGCKELEYVDIDHYKKLGTVFTMFYDYGFAKILKMQVFKQADLVMLFYLMPEKFDMEMMRRNFEYYEKRTLHDSSLSMCIHALVASRLGMTEMADKLYYDSCSVDLGEHTNNSDTGIHSASIGGIWLATVMGYGGLKIGEDGVSLNPILPDGWTKYSFFVNYKNTKLKVTVDNNGCAVNRVSGEEVKVTVNDDVITV